MSKQMPFIEEIGREAIFPTDWIAPGEFQFCQRCGLYLRPKHSPLCPSCRGGKWDEDDGPTPAQLHATREATARSRIEMGIEPLFWMKNN